MKHFFKKLKSLHFIDLYDEEKYILIGLSFEKNIRRFDFAM